jgi:hypothetical protein
MRRKREETDEKIIEHVEEFAGVVIAPNELENYIICLDEDSPLYNDEVLDNVNNIGQFQHDKANNTEYINDNNVHKETETEGEGESS